MNVQVDSAIDPTPSGVTGLDDVLCGGFTPDRLYLVEGAPGSGKTTLAMQFLMEGARRGETTLYITLSETGAELRAVAAAHRWSLDDIHIHEVLPSESILDPDEQYTIFHPSEIEVGATTRSILDIVESLRPARVVLDSLSELQLLASSALSYRRQVLAFKQFFATRSCTTLFLDDRTASETDLQVHSIAHGVISLERLATQYGGIRRRLEVIKYRGVAFREGFHDYRIREGGIIVYPRLIAAETRELKAFTQFATGLPSLDKLLGGGIEVGSSTLITGPPGTGKSTLAAQLVYTCLQHSPAAMFLFEESASNLLNRCDHLGIDLRSHHASGRLLLKQMDPAQHSPGEFTHLICDATRDGAHVVVIDSLNGFLQSMPDEKMLVIHLHELLTWLGQHGVVTLLIGTQQGMMGSSTMTTNIDASYLADNVIMLRYFEAFGEVKQAISIFKKRGSNHERTIREMNITTNGVNIGPVLRQFHGILSGIPKLANSAATKDD